MFMKRFYSSCFIVLLFLSSSIFIGCSGSSVTSSTPEALIKSYVEAPTWEDRLKYILHPDEEKSKMEEYYKDYKPISGTINYNYKEVTKDDNYIVYFVQKTYQDKNTDSQCFVLVKENNIYKIDWEASVVYNEMSWAEFKASKPSSPVKFRTLLQLDDYYNYGFRDKSNDYWSISLSEIDFNNINGYKVLNMNGYVKKDSEAGKKLYEYLKDGKMKVSIVELKYPYNSEGNNNCVEISNIINKGISEEVEAELVKN